MTRKEFLGMGRKGHHGAEQMVHCCGLYYWGNDLPMAEMHTIKVAEGDRRRTLYFCGSE